MANKRVRLYDNIALASNTSLTNAWFLVDKESPDRTERMTATEMFKMDLTKVPFIGQNYVIINAKGTEEDNYSALLAGLTLVNALTPNGNAQSATNRATLYLLGGRYVTASSVVALAPLKFVNIIGIGDRDSIVIGSNSSQPVIKLANDNLNVFKNFTIVNAGAGESFGYNSGQTDNSIMDNLVIGSKTTEGTLFSGKYTNIKCTSDYVLNGSVAGYVDSCTFQSYSCGSSSISVVQLGGIIKNSTGINFCFGSSTIQSVDMDARFENCICSGIGNFGYSEGAGISITFYGGSKIIDCESVNDSFGLATSDGSVVLYSTALFDNCKSGDRSFAHSHTGIVSGYCKMINCIGDDKCFYSTVSGTVLNEGILQGCEATTNSFGDTSSVGRLISCKRTSSYGVHAGFIEKCDFVGDLFISEGATVRRCDIDQGKVNASIPINAKVYLNSLDQIIDANITNKIDTPYNVVDGDI